MDTEVVVVVMGSVLCDEVDGCYSQAVDPFRVAQLDRICNKRLYEDKPNRDPRKLGIFLSKLPFFDLPVSKIYRNNREVHQNECDDTRKITKLEMSFNLPLSSMIHVLCISIHLESQKRVEV
jgi:hypothetical protein